jgi:hypothetical protein
MPEVITNIIAYIRSNRENRLKDYDEIIHNTRIICKPYTLHRALRRAGMNRAVPIPKPFLTLDAKGKRLTFCRFISEWDILDWCRVIFEKEITNANDNVDSKCYANYMVPKLA